MELLDIVVNGLRPDTKIIVMVKNQFYVKDKIIRDLHDMFCECSSCPTVTNNFSITLRNNSIIKIIPFTAESFRGMRCDYIYHYSQDGLQDLSSIQPYAFCCIK